jgi:hypothetical protein
VSRFPGRGGLLDAYLEQAVAAVDAERLFETSVTRGGRSSSGDPHALVRGLLPLGHESTLAAIRRWAGRQAAAETADKEV